MAVRKHEDFGSLLEVAGRELPMPTLPSQETAPSTLWPVLASVDIHGRWRKQTALLIVFLQS